MTSEHSIARDVLRGRLFALRLAASAAIVLAIAACGGGDGGIVEDRKQCTVSSVSVQPGTTTLLVGDQTTLQSLPTSQNCSTTPSTNWSSSAPSVAVVAGNGAVTALAPGSATITATVGSASGTSVVIVQQRPVTSIFVSPVSPIQAGQTVTLSVQPRDDRGQALTGRTVTFSSNANGVATVSPAGVVTGVAPGTAIITVSSEGVNQPVNITVTSRPPASIRVTVIPGTTLTPGATAQVTATVLDAQGTALQGETVVFLSTNQTIATVSGNGLITGVAAGTCVIRVVSATNTAISKDTVITVNPGSASRVDITLAATVNVTQTTTATAVVRDAAGNALPGAGVTWTSSNTTVATVVSTTGVVTGVTAGNTNIIATVVGSPAITGTKALTVAAPVATVNVAQSNVLLEPGPNAGLTFLQLTVTLRDAAQNVLTGRTITYASTNTDAATVSTTGLVTAVGVGTGFINVTSEGITTQVPLVVARAFAVIEANQPTNTSTYQPPQINSAGSPITVTRSSTGRYLVTVGGIGVIAQTIGRSVAAFVNGTNSGINSQLLAPSALCNLIEIDATGPTTLDVMCVDPITLAVKDAPFRAVLVGDNSVGAGGTAAFDLHNTFSGAAYTPNSYFSWNSAGAAMSVTPGFGAPEWGSTQARHTMGITFASQHAVVSALNGTPGVACEVQSQVPGSQFTDVVCFNRTGPVNSLHMVLKLTGGRPGRNGGLAFIDAGTGVNSGQGFNSAGGTVITSRTGAGKYTVVFGGMVATGALGVVVTPWGASGWAACSHYVASLNPVTIDVSCFNSAGGFANGGSALTVLVLQ